MPVEVRELVIKATVNNKHTQPAGDGGTTDISEELINEILNRVFQILEQKQER